FPGQQAGSVGHGTDGGPFPGPLHEAGGGGDLGAHRVRLEGQRPEVVGRDVAQGTGEGGSPVADHGVDVGEQEEDVGVEQGGEERGAAIFVDHRFEAPDGSRGVDVDGDPAATGANDYDARL